MKINKRQLQKAIETVRPGLANKEQIEQATSFVFKGGKVITYNDEISLSHPVEGLELTGAIKAEELHKLLSKLKQDEIEVEISGNEIQLKAGKAKAWFTLQQEIKLPLEEISKQGKWKNLPKGFIDPCKFTMAACSRDMSRPVLTCVHINKDRIEGSDGYKIAQCRLSEKMPVSTLLIPATSVNELIKMKPSKIAEGQGGWIHFCNDEGTIMSCRVFEDEYVNITPLLNIEGPEIEFPESFKESIDRASIFAKRDNILDEQVEISIEKKKITVSGESDAGRFIEKAPLKYDGGNIQFYIAPYLLADILSETRICVLGDNRMKFEGENWIYISALQMKK